MVTKTALHYAILMSTGITEHAKPKPDALLSCVPTTHIQMGKQYLLEDHLCSGNQIPLKKHLHNQGNIRQVAARYLFECFSDFH